MLSLHVTASLVKEYLFVVCIDLHPLLGTDEIIGHVVIDVP
jgi:hypothetical protein